MPGKPEQGSRKTSHRNDTEPIRQRILVPGCGPKLSRCLVAGQNTDGLEKNRQPTAADEARTNPTPCAKLWMKKQGERENPDRNGQARKS
jgi:hypothetical protein